MNAPTFSYRPRWVRPATQGATICLLILVAPLVTTFAQQRDVVINEIAWMGTLSSFNDEWIELFNNTGTPIDLTGWTLNSLDGTPSITIPSGSIDAGGYFLLERTDDTSVQVWLPTTFTRERWATPGRFSSYETI